MKKTTLRQQVKALEQLAGLSPLSTEEAKKANGGRRRHKTSNSVTLALGSGGLLIRKGSGHLLVRGSGALLMKGTGQ